MQTDSKTESEPQVRCDDLLAAVKAWRSTEVHHAAITLGLRDGDEQLARAKLDDCTRELRIAADDYLKAANDEIRQAGPETHDNHKQRNPALPASNG